MSKKSIYTPATIKKDFNLRIYCKLKNLFYISYIDHLIISTNSYLSFHLITTYHKGRDFARIGTLMQIKKRMVSHPLLLYL